MRGILIRGVRPGSEVPPRALLISLAALAVPVVGSLSFPSALADIEALLWLLALIPAFLLSYYRGWRAVATSLAAGMAALSLTYASTQALGHEPPALLPAIVVAYLAVSLGLGMYAEQLSARLLAVRDRLSFFDAETGLPGRGYAMFFLEKEFAAAERGRPVTVVRFALDDLPDFEARHGHDLATQALRLLSQRLATNTRRMNLASHLGGGEFLCVLGSCDFEGGILFAQRFQELMRSAPQPHPTISAGVAAYTPEMEEPTALIRAAEDALREARTDGGDRLRLHGRSLEQLLSDVPGVSPAREAPDAGEPATAGTERIGTGRSAFLFIREPTLAQRVFRFLSDEGFTVRRARSLADTMPAVSAEHDLVILDLSPASAVARLTHEIRARYAMTRILGVPEPIGDMVAAAALDVPVDAYWLPTAELGGLRRSIATVLAERDALQATALAERQLTDELRATSREAQIALRRSEERHRTLIAEMSDILAIVDVRGSVRYCSPSISRVLGLEPDALIGRSPQDLLHPDDLESIRAALGPVATTRGAGASSEVRIRDAAGDWRTLEVIVRNLTDSPGIEGLVVSARDVTERRRTERELRESREMLAQSQKMEAVGRLAGGIAHDFNNLLTVIHGHIELLLEQLDEGDELRHDLVEIREAAGRAGLLTRQLLAFGRRQVLQPRVVDPAEVVRVVEKMLGRLIGEDIELVTDLGSTGHIRVDPSQIEQVLVNLGVNAREAMPGGGRLSVRSDDVTLDERAARALDIPPGAYVRLTIQDTGSGMDAETIEHVFEPFFTTKAARGGTGLGLATVYGIVKQSGGTVDVESRTGTGTTFTLYFPRTEPGADAAVDGSGAPGALDKVVLVVEDERSVRELASRILSRAGLTVVTAADAATALRILDDRQRRIDLLLSDVVMPEMGGRELADRALRLRPELPILFMSGYTEEAIARHGVLLAGTVLLEKPFTPEQLLGRVRAVLSGH
ncbi:MAG: ATP-binding protein, partial [Longimicrobiales bacterium]